MALIMATEGEAMLKPIDKQALANFLKDEIHQNRDSLEKFKQILNSKINSLETDPEERALLEALIGSSLTKKQAVDAFTEYYGLNEINLPLNPHEQSYASQVNKDYLDTLLLSLVDGVFNDQKDVDEFKNMLQTVLDELPLNTLSILDAPTKQSALDKITETYGIEKIILPEPLFNNNNINHSFLSKKRNRNNIQHDDENTIKKSEDEKVVSIPIREPINSVKISGDQKESSVKISGDQKELLFNVLYRVMSSRTEKDFNLNKELLQAILDQIAGNNIDIRNIPFKNKGDINEMMRKAYLVYILQGG